MTEEKLTQEGVFEEIEETKSEEIVPEDAKLNNGVVIYTTEDGSVYHNLIGKVTLKDAIFYKEYLARVTEELWDSVSKGE